MASKHFESVYFFNQINSSIKNNKKTVHYFSTLAGILHLNGSTSSTRLFSFSFSFPLRVVLFKVWSLKQLFLDISGSKCRKNDCLNEKQANADRLEFTVRRVNFKVKGFGWENFRFKNEIKLKNLSNTILQRLNIKLIPNFGQG